MVIDVFYIFLKALSVLKIFFCSYFLGYVEKRLDKKAKADFNVYDVRNWNKSKCNKHIAKYLKKSTQSDNEIWSVNGT